MGPSGMCGSVDRGVYHITTEVFPQVKAYILVSLLCYSIIIINKIYARVSIWGCAPVGECVRITLRIYIRDCHSYPLWVCVCRTPET